MPLFDQLEGLFRCIEPDAQHRDVFSHDLRHLLMLTCAEIESGLKAVLKSNGRSKPRYDLTDYYALLTPLRLHEWKLQLRSYPDFGTLTPFAGWTAAAAPYWWTAHNKAKHDREHELGKATFGAAIEAMAALHIVIAAQFGADVLGAMLPVQVTVDGYPRWAPEEYYAPPEANTDWTAVNWTP